MVDFPSEVSMAGFVWVFYFGLKVLIQTFMRNFHPRRWFFPHERYSAFRHFRRNSFWKIFAIFILTDYQTGRASVVDYCNVYPYMHDYCFEAWTWSRLEGRIDSHCGAALSDVFYSCWKLSRKTHLYTTGRSKDYAIKNTNLKLELRSLPLQCQGTRAGRVPLYCLRNSPNGGSSKCRISFSYCYGFSHRVRCSVRDVMAKNDNYFAKNIAHDDNRKK